MVLGVLREPIVIYHAYLPTVPRHGGVSFDLSDNKISTYTTALSAWDAPYIRIGFGSSVSNTDTPYQRWKTGGWIAVDAEVKSDIDGIRSLGAEPIVISMHGGNCTPAPTLSQLNSYGNWLVSFINRYQLQYIEVWNEPDAEGSGLPSLYGCGPPQNNMISLLEQVRAATTAQVGTSFMFNSPNQQAYVQAVSPHADFIGIHIYATYWIPTGQIGYAWPGSPVAAYTLATQLSGQRPLITEANLREPSYDCANANFQTAQSGFINNQILSLKAPVTVLFTYNSNPAWECTGLNASQFEIDYFATPFPYP